MKSKSFRAMSPAQKRVAIARDVIAGLKVKHLIAAKGVYCTPADMRLFCDSKATDQYADLFKKTTCEVCGIGAVFVAAVELFNEHTITDHLNCCGVSEKSNRMYRLPHSIAMRRYLEQYFSASQLRLIETIFEQWTSDISDNNALVFSLKYKDPTKRMTAIMRNIIKNKGIFNP